MWRIINVYTLYCLPQGSAMVGVGVVSSVRPYTKSMLQKTCVALKQPNVIWNKSGCFQGYCEEARHYAAHVLYHSRTRSACLYWPLSRLECKLPKNQFGRHGRPEAREWKEGHVTWPQLHGGA